jgi:hypothetical protein
VGKSSFALWWAIHMDAPCLYLSIDSDLPTQAARTVSMLTGIKFESVKEDIPAWTEYLKTLNRQLPMMLDCAMGADEIDSAVQAYEEFYSRKPPLVIVDNLKDVVAAGEYGAYVDAVKSLIRVAKHHRTVVLVLHHINRQSRAGDGRRPPSLDDGKFGGEDDAPFVLGLWQGWDEFLGPVFNARILKNRFGPKEFDVKMQFDFETMQVRDV